MKLALAQMNMSEDGAENLARSLEALRESARQGADLVLFPEIQLSPFFPQYEGRSASGWLLTPESGEIAALRRTCREAGIWASPNVYLSLDGKPYDASLLIDSAGELRGISKMVHIAQAEKFYEQDYYTPSDDGFRIYETPWGRAGIVICFDRHLPESIRTCALRGAELILIPTANTRAEDMELFEWEVRVQAMQNGVYIAMCNRTGSEGEMSFAGESLLAGPDGEVIVKAGGGPGLILAELDLRRAGEARCRRPYLTLRRPESYER